MKKKILITNGHLRIGGVEKSLVNFLNAIDYSKYDVDLLLFEGTGEYLSAIPKEVNIILCDLTKTYGSLFQIIFKNILDHKVIQRKIILTLSNKLNRKYIRYLIKSKEYDVALAYRVDMPMDYVSYGIKAKKKYFWWHNGSFDYPKHQVRRWQESAQNMDGLVCVSNSIRRTIEPYFDSYVKTILVIPNMISIQEDLDKINDAQINKDTYTIVSVGRFSKEKHMRDCVLAAKKLIQKGHQNLRWYLLGDGPEKEAAMKDIASNNLQNVVVCLGGVSDPYSYMKSADLIVHPSYIESQGMTVLEAMKLKKLVVATGSDGVNEYAIDHKNALISKMSINSLVEKIEEAMNMNEDGRAKICEAAKLTADRYCPEVIMRQIEGNLFSD